MKFLILTAVFFLGCAQSNSTYPPLLIPDVPEVSHNCEIVPEIADTAKPNVLIVGDSISLLYTAGLRASLPSYDVHHNPCNAQSSIYTLRHVDEWLSLQNDHDIIIFNNGIWDSGLTVPVSVYKNNMKAIAQKIKAKTNKYFFITTTFSRGADPVKFNKYRNASLEAMAEEGVPVIDLKAHVEANNIQPGPDGTHFEAAESDLIGAFLASELSK